MRVMHGNNGLQKPRPNNVAILGSINKIGDQNSDKYIVSYMFNKLI